MPLFDQTGDLGAAVAAGVLEVAQQNATAVFTATRVVKAFEHPADMRVPLHVACVGRKSNFGTAVKKLLDLFNRAKLGLIHVDHHFWISNNLPVHLKLQPQAHSCLEIQALAQAHTSLDKALP